MELFSPGRYKGFRSLPDGAALPQGVFKRAENLRYERGVLDLRKGITAVASGPGTGTYLGGTLVAAGDNVLRLYAMNVSGTVRLYYQVYNGSVWSAASEGTASSGKRGNTRMNPPSSGNVTFTPVWSEYGQLDVLVSNGSQAPRLFNFNNTYTTTVNAVTAPTEHSAFSPRFSAKGNLNITAASTATNSTGARFAASTTGSPQYWLWTFTTPTVGDTAQMVCDSATVDCSASTQLWLIAEASEDAVFDCCKIEAVQGGSYYTLHDPQNGKDNLLKVPCNDSGTWVYALPIGDHALAVSLSTVKGLRFTVQNTGITAGATLKVWSVCASGRVPGLSQYAVSYRNSESRAESPSVVMPANPEADGVAGIWGSTASPLPSGFRLPLSELLDYQVSVPVVAPSTSARDAGVDYVDIWRSDPGEDAFYYVYEVQTAAYSGSWAYSGAFASAQRSDYTDNVPTWAKSSIKRAPDAYNEPVPVGQASLFSGGRLYVGSQSGSSHTSALLMVSAKDFPYRFRRIADPDDIGGSGYSSKLGSGEKITAFAATSLGTAVYCFTDRAVWGVDTPRVDKVAEPGCFSPTGAGVHGQAVVYVSTEATFRTPGEDLSRYKVDELDSADLSKVALGSYRERIFIAFSDSGTDKVLVYNTALREFESLDTPAVAVKQFHPWTFYGQNKLYASLSNGNIVEYGEGATDSGTDIAFTLEPGELYGRDMKRVKIGPSTIVATDADADATFTYTGDSTQTGTIDLSSPDTVWKIDKQASGGDTGVSGSTVSVSLSATLEHPWTLKHWSVKTEGKRGIGESS